MDGGGAFLAATRQTAITFARLPLPAGSTPIFGKRRAGPTGTHPPTHHTCPSHRSPQATHDTTTTVVLAVVPVPVQVLSGQRRPYKTRARRLVTRRPCLVLKFFAKFTQ